MTTALASSSLLLARIARVDRSGRPWLLLPGSDQPQPGEALAGIAPAALRAAAAAGTPAVAGEVGCTWTVLGFLAASPAPAAAAVAEQAHQVIEAEGSLTLRAGKASITLTREGKVLIKGGYVLSRSTGANVIKGRPTAIN